MNLRWLPVGVYTLLALCVAAFAMFLSVPATAGAQTEPTVTVVTIDEEIRAGTHQFLNRSLGEAIASEHDLFLLEINTPGGLLAATEQISRALIDSPIPTAVYVHEDAGWAFSAGVFILLSADTAAMHPTASLGAASPILGDGGAADEKTTNATLSWLRTLAERNDRDADLAATFITENVTMTGTEAYDAGLIDATATNRAGLLADLGYADAQIHQSEPNTIDATLSFFSIPYLVPILLTLGALGLFLAVRTGEIEVTGAVSFILLLLGLWGAGMIELSAFGVIVLIVGITLVVIELFLEGSDFGASGVLGLLAISFGIATFAQEPLFPDVFSYGFFPILLGLFVGFSAVLFGLSYFAASAIRQPHAVGVETLLGREATVQQQLAPTGVIMLDGERYTARVADSTVRIEPGATVRIDAMEGNTAVVSPTV